MAYLRFISRLFYLTICITAILAAPPIPPGDLENFNSFPYGSTRIFRSANHIEVRGVVGGRKKRYVVKRKEGKQCCRNRPKCRAILGEILEDCECKMCRPGTVVNPRTGKCANKCPTGLHKTPDGKGCCGLDEKPNANGTECEPDCDPNMPPTPQCPKEDSNEDEEKQRKGKCGDDEILDPKLGDQYEWTENPQCIPDDSKNCGRGEISETREPGDNDPNKKMRCAKPDDNNRKRCNPKRYYVQVRIQTQPDGKLVAKEECKPTKQWSDKKRNKMKEVKSKQQKKWEKSKSKGNLKKFIEDIKKKTKENIVKKKKARMGKCLTVVSLMQGVAFNPVGIKRSNNLTTRAEEEHPYEYVADYFDEDFVTGDDILQHWPEDLEWVEDVAVDENAWTSAWYDAVQNEQLENNQQTCNSFGGKKRCKRAIPAEPWEPITNKDRLHNWTSAIRLSNSSNLHGDPTTPEFEKRFVQLIPILIDIATFAGRMAAALLSRVSGVLRAASQRLATIVGDSGRLFQVAKAGQGARGGLQAMKNAAGRVAKGQNWRRCLKEGIPV